MTNWMLLNSGGAAIFGSTGASFLNLDKDDLLWDFARALAGINRCAGRIPWNVAQHSILVASLLPQGLRLEGLLHDAHEAISGDIPMPFDRWLPEMARLALDAGKGAIQSEFEARIGYVSAPAATVGSNASMVHVADQRAFLVEVKMFFGDSRELAAENLCLEVPDIIVDEDTSKLVIELSKLIPTHSAWRWKAEVEAALKERRNGVQDRG